MESSSLSREATVPADQPPTTEAPPALVVLLTVNGRRFSSLAKVADHLKSLQPDDRYCVVNSQAEGMIELQGSTDMYMNYLDRYVREDAELRSRMDQDPDNWGVVEEAAKRHQAQKKKLQTQTKLFERWGEDKVRYYFAHVFDMGETSLSKLKRVAAMYPDLDAAILRIRCASLWRLQNPASAFSSRGRL
jgi:hypothetical protein